MYVQFLCQAERQASHQSIHGKCHKKGSGGKLCSCPSGPVLTLWEINHLDLNPKPWLSSAVNIGSSNSLKLHTLWSRVTLIQHVKSCVSKSCNLKCKRRKNEWNLSKVKWYKMKFQKCMTRAFEHPDYLCHTHVTLLWKQNSLSGQKSKHKKQDFKYFHKDVCT